ncbi:atrial natriuretic peptide receptor 2-like isoform X2 [Amphiura filiformis]|uniref:atrial natriuretic peptide receptor 2-like isoform X2 n=1 Tax=Amphiura filiformis TaxID=82378 RepID=UPI003B219621
MESITCLLRLLRSPFMLLFILDYACAWHQLDNSKFHCWPLSNPNENNYLEDCMGFHMDFVVDPPSEITSGDTFMVNFTLHAADSFFDWGVRNDTPYAEMYEPVFKGYGSGAEAKAWCTNTKCPPPSAAKKTNCCYHHVNLHSCPQEALRGSICGPWVPPDGDIFTHTQSQVGSSSQTEWFTTVALVPTGVTSIIVHVRVGNLQGALHHVVTVNPRSVCGDKVCEEEEGESCSTCPADCGNCPLSPAALSAIAIVSVFVLVGFCSIFAYFYWRQEKMLWDESWIIDYSEIKADTGMRAFMGSVISFRSNNSASSGGGGFASNAQSRQMFTETGILNGQTIAIKKVNKMNFQLDKRIRKEVKQIRYIHHPNLCKFIGGSIVVPDVVILTEYCPKGGLNDVLLNDDVPLNWSFRFSFCNDIARGMNYLHNSKIFHGRLKSSNCVIDDRWVVKITDYGLPCYRHEEGNEDEDLTYRQQMNRIYTAPECVQNPNALMTPGADAYSFSVIMVEIASRQEPCDSDDFDRIDSRWRPSLPDLTDCDGSAEEDKCPCPDDYVKLIKRCWDENPNVRPPFSQIKNTLYNINPNKKSPVDIMMQLMEKYSKHLETLVAERTQDLMFEKQKTDRLLYSMLPKPVADDLRQGNPAQAENFNQCTIFFSDIVGFTSLSSESSPFEVVALLNKLYVTFDSIIDIYDVYKVETIGDAYMVVSGVPQRNGNQHAGEIASMALDLVKVCETFIIPHKPDQNLKIRAGIHSGSVVAGVIGLKMPRYCLFGDTVNTASRMESTGEALKIQASEACVNVLHQLGGYIYDQRGELAVKGKGIMLTYWLTGKVQNNHPLDSTHTLITTTGVELIDNHELSNSKQTEFPATNEEHDLMEMNDTSVNRKISLPGNSLPGSMDPEADTVSTSSQTNLVFESTI